MGMNKVRKKHFVAFYGTSLYQETAAKYGGDAKSTPKYGGDGNMVEMTN